MKLPEIPDLSAALEQIAKAQPIKLAPGDRFIAQIDSVVIPREAQKATGVVWLAFFEYMSGSLQMLEEIASEMTEPQSPLTEEDKKEARGLISKSRSAREEIQAALAKGLGKSISPSRPPSQP